MPIDFAINVKRVEALNRPWRASGGGTGRKQSRALLIAFANRTWRFLDAVACRRTQQNPNVTQGYRVIFHSKHPNTSPPTPTLQSLPKTVAPSGGGTKPHAYVSTRLWRVLASYFWQAPPTAGLYDQRRQRMPNASTSLKPSIIYY